MRREKNVQQGREYCEDSAKLIEIKRNYEILMRRNDIEKIKINKKKTEWPAI